MIAIIALAIDAHRAVVGILIVSIMHRFKLPIQVGIILNGANVFLSVFSGGVSDLFALATLAERARARLLSMTGSFAHRAVIWAVPASGTMRFVATVSAFHDRQ